MSFSFTFSGYIYQQLVLCSTAGWGQMERWCCWPVTAHRWLKTGCSYWRCPETVETSRNSRQKTRCLHMHSTRRKKKKELIDSNQSIYDYLSFHLSIYLWLSVCLNAPCIRDSPEVQWGRTLWETRVHPDRPGALCGWPDLALWTSHQGPDGPTANMPSSASPSGQWKWSPEPGGNTWARTPTAWKSQRTPPITHTTWFAFDFIFTHRFWSQYWHFLKLRSDFQSFLLLNQIVFGVEFKLWCIYL